MEQRDTLHTGELPSGAKGQRLPTADSSSSWLQETHVGDREQLPGLYTEHRELLGRFRGHSSLGQVLRRLGVVL